MPINHNYAILKYAVIIISGRDALRVMGLIEAIAGVFVLVIGLIIAYMVYQALAFGTLFIVILIAAIILGNRSLFSRVKIDKRRAKKRHFSYIFREIV